MNFVNTIQDNLQSNTFGNISNVQKYTDKIIFFFIVVLSILFIGIIIVCIFKCIKNKKNNFTDKKKVSFDEYVKPDDLIFIYNDMCPFSNKLKEDLILTSYHLNGQQIKMINFESTQGKSLRSKFNIDGTPAIIKFKNNKPNNIILGYFKLDELVKKLNENENKNENKNENENFQNNEILLIGSNSCGFCTRQKKFFEDKNIKYKWINSSDPEGIKYMEKYKSNGVPLIVIIKDGNETHNIGYTENLF